MAALCPGVHYGLSSQQNYGENRDLIFVKLTDSALRAIEEYLKNQNKFNNHKPTIKFLGNENGELSFPSLHHPQQPGGGRTSFNFSVSSTADVEGQQGSFECIEQAGAPRGPLEGLGSIPRKMRVHANDDVYEVTRTRMTEAEDKYKNKCTREIKPTQTDIGRKVKVKQPSSARGGGGAPLHPVHPRKEMPSMRDSLLKQPQPSSYTPQPASYQSQPVGNSKPVLPPSHHHPHPPPPHHHHHVHSSTANGALPNGLGSSHVGSTRAKPEVGKKASGPEAPRRPISRKPPPAHTLTPPSDGSSGGSCGQQSPNSTHPGSPPPPVVTSSKRPGFHEGPDGFAYKRQRIAHATRPPAAAEPAAGRSPQPPFESGALRRAATDSRDASNMNPRSRESPVSAAGYFSNGYHRPAAPNGGPPPPGDKQRHSSDDDDKEPTPFDGGLAFRSSQDVEPLVAVKYEPPAVKYEPLAVKYEPPAVKYEPPEPKRERSPVERQNGYAGRQVNGRVRPPPADRDMERAAKYNKVSSSTDNRIARVSPDSQTDGMPVPEPDPSPYPGSDADFVEKENEFPDYRKQYVTIRDPDQRRRYKVDFNADYAEYRDLHTIVEKVSRKFALLEERLKQEDINSPRYKDIRKQIVVEYQESKKDAEHQRAKRRFQYLHDKLSHIKKLVTEYDQDMADCRY